MFLMDSFHSRFSWKISYGFRGTVQSRVNGTVVTFERRHEALSHGVEGGQTRFFGHFLLEDAEERRRRQTVAAAAAAAAAAAVGGAGVAGFDGAGAGRHVVARLGLDVHHDGVVVLLLLLLLLLLLWLLLWLLRLLLRLLWLLLLAVILRIVGGDDLDAVGRRGTGGRRRRTGHGSSHGHQR